MGLEGPKTFPQFCFSFAEKKKQNFRCKKCEFDFFSLAYSAYLGPNAKFKPLPSLDFVCKKNVQKKAAENKKCAEEKKITPNKLQKQERSKRNLRAERKKKDPEKWIHTKFERKKKRPREVDPQAQFEIRK